MDINKNATPELWIGRGTGERLYVHEIVECLPLEELATVNDKPIFALLGYACDEGVQRNQGRIGTIEGPDTIRRMLGKFPNHLPEQTRLLDLGNIVCSNGDMEGAQHVLSQCVTQILKKGAFPVLLGGGHDIAYGHYKGIQNYLGPERTLGIINFDAHFDLRSNDKGNNSGTPFYQIAQDGEAHGQTFHYLCLGIRKDANTKNLFQTAKELHVDYIENDVFNITRMAEIKKKILGFMAQVDRIYVTIDMDGFSAAYAPGVSAAYPTGYAPEVVFETLKIILGSKKLISLDIAEMNPAYDIDNRTAKLAAALVHFLISAN